MSSFQPFLMERMMSAYEQDVDINLTESGVHPVTVGELLQHRPQGIDELLATELNYPYTNGIPRLRENIAGLYDGATAENVLVTVGAIEANYITILSLLDPGDEIVTMLPNYMQIWGAAQNHGFKLKSFHLREESDWSPDFDELEECLSEQTKLIAVCNPNNPTGRILTGNEMDQIVRLASRYGSWILADEVYSGAERLTDEQTPSFYGRYDKVVAVGSLSKAYGLPGLRIGWVVAPTENVQDIWMRHEYMTISGTMLGNQLAALALEPEIRSGLLDRTRNYIRNGYPILQQWMESHPGTFTVTPPEASAVAFVRYHLDINSTEFMERLRVEKGTLIVPGDHFGMDHFMRISFGLPKEYLQEGLDRIHQLISELQ